MRFSPVFTNFLSGEFSPKLYGRVDLESFFNSARLIQNYMLIIQGGVIRRPGSYYLTSTKTDQIARLIPFYANTTTRYMLEFTNLLMRVYKDGVIVGGPYELATVFTEAELFAFQFVQGIPGEMYIVHPSHRPQKLTWTADTTWAIAAETFTGDAPNNFNAAGDYPSCICFFQQRCWLAATNNNPNYVWGSRTPTIGGATRYTDFTLSDDPMVDSLGVEMVISDDGDRIRWIIGKDYMLVGTETGEHYLSGGEAPISPLNAWTRGATNHGSANVQAIKAGNAVLFVDQYGPLREIMWNATRETYEATNLSLLADHLFTAVPRQLAVQKRPLNIIWVLSDNRELRCITYESVYDIHAWVRVEMGGDGEVESMAVLPGVGGAEDEIYLVVKRVINSATVRFVERLKPIFGSWTTADIAATATEIKHAFFVDAGITHEETNTAAITNATKTDPVVITCGAGHPFANGDYVEITDVVGMVELNDRNYKVAGVAGNDFNLKTTDGVDVDGTGYTAYDSGGTADAITNEVTGLTHLQGEAVQVFADGGDHPDRTVAGGKISLDNFYKHIHVGLQEISELQPMKLEAGSQFGTSQSYIKRISKIWVRFWKSIGARYGSRSANMTDFEFFTGDETMGEGPDLFTGDKKDVFPGGYEESGDIVIQQVRPLPQAVMAIILRLQTYETEE